jgi:hypothetical protein
MMRRHFATALALSLTWGALGAGALDAQDPPHPNPPGLPLQPPAPRSGIVAPYFDGWFQNPDGSRTFSFGYLNRSTDTASVVEIPIGPDNFIEPEQYDGMQPEHFRVVNYGGFSGPRERGTFAVTVPADFQGDVVWTITSNGQTYSVPGRAKSVAYQLGTTPQAAGSLRPIVRLAADGPVGWGPKGIVKEEVVTAKVGVPVSLGVWGQDMGQRNPTALNMTWQKHQGPVGGTVVFEPRTLRLPTDGETPNQGTTTATFSAPGDYVLRVRIDNFTVSDSSFGNMCCWSNGFIRVRVTP